MQVVIIIPYRTFKQRLNIVKRYSGTGSITVEEKFVMIEQNKYASREIYEKAI